MTPELQYVGFVVEDLTTSLAFYSRLGLDLPSPVDRDHVEVTLPGGLNLAWDTVDTIRSFDPHRETPAGGHRMGLAFRCADPADVDGTYRELIGAGYRGHLEPWDAFWGQRVAAVYDPDGNSIEFFAPLPGSSLAQ